MLEQKIFEFVTQYQLIENGDKIVLGVSGGPDSIAMFDILYKISKEINFDICVAHINHGLRENASIDEKFVKDFCEKLKVPFFVRHVNIKQIAQEQKCGIEETGRKIRYEFFDEIMEKTMSNKIAIAHHCNDNAETILMNLLRGTGTKGLMGIEKKNGKYIRPLLETKRQEIDEYLKQNHIVARHDESNDDNTYTRNKIRNVLIPYLEKEFNPNLIGALQRLSCIIKEDDEYWQKKIPVIYEQVCIEEKNVTKNYTYNKSNHAEIIMDLKKFNTLEKMVQKKIILYAIQKIFGTTQRIEKIHMEDIVKLCNNNIGNKYLTPNKHIKIVTQKKQLKIMAVTC